MSCARMLVLFCFLGLVGAQPAWAQLTVSSGALVFVQTGSTPPRSQTLSVSATGVLSFAFTAVAATTTGGSWLTVTGAGTGPANLTVSANGTGLAPGLYRGSIVITAAAIAGSPRTIPVELAVLAVTSGAVIVRPDELEFEAHVGGPPPAKKQITIMNPMTASFSWTATTQVNTPSGGNWLSVSPTSGTGMAVLDVTVNPAGLPSGEFKGKIIITSGSNTSSVEVELEVESQGSRPIALRLEPRTIHFEFESSASASRSRDLEVNVQGSAAASWTTSASVETPSGGTWLSVTPASGTGQGKLRVTANPAGLSPGLYSGKITVNGGAAGSDETRVFLRVGNPQHTRVHVTPRAVHFSFSLATGLASPASRNIQIKSKGSATFTATSSTAAGGNWLSITPASGAVPGSLTASLNAAVAATLAPGLYTGNIRITTAGGTPGVTDVHVSLRVRTTTEPPELEVSPGAMVFHATAGGSSPAPQTVRLRAENTASIAWTAAASTAVGGNWLSVSPASGTATASATSNVTVTVNSSGLAAGVYGGAVVFTPASASGAPLFTVLVKLIVTSATMIDMSAAVPVEAAAQPTLAMMFDPSSGFRTQVGVPVNLSVTVLDTNGQPVEGSTVVVTSSGAEPAVVLEDVGDGEYAGVFRPLAAGSVTLTAQVDGQASTRTFASGTAESASSVPAVFQGGVVSAASFAPAPSPLAAGSLASIFGLSIAGRTAAAASLPLVTTMEGVTVTVGGIPAPLLSLNAGASDQINVQIPFELSGATQASVMVNNNGLISGSETIQIGSAPALFTTAQTGAGAGAFLHADFSPVTSVRAVAAGETILLFGTGFGEVSPSARTGAAASAITRVNGDVRVTIGGRDCPVVFAGLAPGFVGLYQINVVVPSGVVSGEQRVDVSLNGISSTGRATVMIQ